MLVQFYNALKTWWSNLNDAIMRGAPRRPVPFFLSPEAAGGYLFAHARYTGDPGNGVADFFLHPERLQAAMEQGDAAFAGLSVDCDDFASWAFFALRQMRDCTPTIYTLRDAGLVGSHVITVYRQGGKCGAIDTSGHRLLPNLDPDTLCRVWSEMYASRGYRYVEAVVTPNPFS